MNNIAAPTNAKADAAERIALLKYIVNPYVVEEIATPAESLPS
jgi:hypothetical protein